jgi:hypothetical protein
VYLRTFALTLFCLFHRACLSLLNARLRYRTTASALFISRRCCLLAHNNAASLLPCARRSTSPVPANALARCNRTTMDGHGLRARRGAPPSRLSPITVTLRHRISSFRALPLSLPPHRNALRWIIIALLQ